MPVTANPTLAFSTAKGRPTYPSPTTPTWAVWARMRAMRSLAPHSLQRLADEASREKTTSRCVACSEYSESLSTPEVAHCDRAVRARSLSCRWPSPLAVLDRRPPSPGTPSLPLLAITRASASPGGNPGRQTCACSLGIRRPDFTPRPSSLEKPFRHRELSPGLPGSQPLSLARQLARLF